MKQKQETATAEADICFVLEGTWPYVRGGVSSWVDQLINGLPDLTFSVVFIGGQRSTYGEPRYKIPSNVIHLETVFLEDAWQPIPHARRRRTHADERELDKLYRYFHAPQEADEYAIKQVLQVLTESTVTRADIMHSRASWDRIVDSYMDHCPDPSFINYFWTLRTMQAPVMLLAELARRLPRARALHTVSTGYAGLLGCLLQKRWQCQLMLTEHGIYTKERKIDLAQATWIAENPDELMNQGLDVEVNYTRRLWIRFFERIGLLTYHASSVIVALYENNRLRQIKDGASPERTRVIPNGIDLSSWTKLREERPKTAPLTVGLIGRIVPIKDVKTFVRAMRSVIDQCPEAKGWIVGPEEEDPEYVAECKSLVASLGLEEHVQFLGFQKIHDVMPKLGVMVLTSISEAQPLVVLEAWAAGTPVVTTDVGACREMIEGSADEKPTLGHAGVVVPMASPEATARSIIDLLKNSERWCAVQSVGVQRVEANYSDVLMLSRYRTLYQQLMER